MNHAVQNAATHFTTRVILQGQATAQGGILTSIFAKTESHFDSSDLIPAIIHLPPITIACSGLGNTTNIDVGTPRARPVVTTVLGAAPSAQLAMSFQRRWTNNRNPPGHQRPALTFHGMVDYIRMSDGTLRLASAVANVDYDDPSQRFDFSVGTELDVSIKIGDVCAMHIQERQ